MSKKEIISIALTFVAGVVIGTIISATFFMNAKYKAAIVDVPQIVSASTKITALKAEEAVKIQELQNFIQKAKDEIDAAKDEKKKQELIAKYEETIAARKIEIERDYATKLSQIDGEITKIIANKAKEAGFDVVFAKSNVIYGGENITDTIVLEVK